MKKIISGKFGISLVVYLILTAGIFLSFFIFFEARKAQIKIIDTEFDIIASDRANNIINGILKDIGLLETIGYFYKSSQSVERNEFHDFTKNIIDSHPEIYEFRWLPKVLASERRAFEESVLNEELEKFYIKEFDKEGNAIRAGDREQYFPIFYIEPPEKDASSFGIDVASFPERWNAMQKARDTGNIAIATKTKVMEEFTGLKSVTRVFLPVYANNSIHETVDQRRDNLTGFVSMLYNTEILVDVLLKDMRGRGVDTYIYNEAFPEGEKLICFDYSRARGKAIAPIFGEEQLIYIKGFAWKQYYQVSGTNLTVICRPAPAFLKRHNIKYTWGILGFSLLVTIALFIYLNNITTYSSRIEMLVKRRTEELEKTRRKFHAVFNQAFQLIGLLEKDGKLIEINEAALRLIGVKEPDVIGKLFWETPWWSHSKEMQDRLRAAIKTVSEGGFERFEAIHPGPDGSVHYVDFSLKPIKDKDGSVIFMIPEGRDITDRKSMEEKLKNVKEDLENKNEELKKLDKLKSNFVSVVSHELRTPLGPIKEGAKIILDGLTGEINAEQRDLLDTVNRNADRLNRLINNVLDFQKLESGAMTFDFKEGVLGEVIGEVYNAMKLVTSKKGIKFEMEVEQNIPNIYFDRDKIIQVLTNLINNAFKFTDAGSIKIKAKREANIVHVRVEDTGPGIKEEDMPKLFQTFSQLSLAEEKKAGGSGLGLAISKEIILRHRGKIWVESKVGRGSCFQFVLPIEDRRRN